MLSFNKIIIKIDHSCRTLLKVVFSTLTHHKRLCDAQNYVLWALWWQQSYTRSLSRTEESF